MITVLLNILFHCMVPLACSLQQKEKLVIFHNLFQGLIQNKGRVVQFIIKIYSKTVTVACCSVAELTDPIQHDDL